MIKTSCKISIIASISVKCESDITNFISKWYNFLNDKIELIVCVNKKFKYDCNLPFVKVVEYLDDGGMFKFKIQKKKYFAACHSDSDYMLFIHERIFPNKSNFFLELLKFLKSNDPEYLSFIVNNTNGTKSLSHQYLYLPTKNKDSFLDYLNELKKSRGCVFIKNDFPALNGAVFLLRRNVLKLLDNNFRWGEMEDLKLSFDLFQNNFKGFVFDKEFFVTQVYKSEMKDVSSSIRSIYHLISLVYYLLHIFFKFSSVYSNLNIYDIHSDLKKKKYFLLIDLLHKPFHTGIYKNSLEKVLTLLRTLDPEIELKYSRTFLGYKIHVDE